MMEFSAENNPAIYLDDSDEDDLDEDESDEELDEYESDEES